jgi:hypothetical protein
MLFSTDKFRDKDMDLDSNSDTDDTGMDKDMDMDMNNLNGHHQKRALKTLRFQTLQSSVLALKCLWKT